MTLTQLLSDLGLVWGKIMESIPSALTSALSSPVVIVFIGCAFAGVIVGFAKKILHF